MANNEKFGAMAVSAVFKIAAVIVLIGGIIAAIVIAATSSSGAATSIQTTTSSDSARIGLAVAVGVGSILYAAVLAFFGYVLDYLREIRDNTDQIPTVAGEVE